MDPTAVYCFLATASASLFFFFFFLISHILRNLKTKTPCPASHPIIGNLIAFIKNHHRFLDWVTDLISTTPSNTIQVHGIIGTTPGVCTANPTNVEHILKTNFSNYVKGHRFRSVLSDFLGDGIFNADSDLWFSQRKIASHEFNTRSLKSFVADTVRSEISARLIPYLRAVSYTGDIVDLQDVFRRFAFDNICNLAFGDDPQCLELYSTAIDVSPFVRAFDEAVEISSSRFLTPVPSIWKAKRLLNVGSEKRLREAIRIVNDYAMKIIRSREEEGEDVKKNKQDLLSRFMSSTDDLGFQNDPIRKRKFLRDIIISFILAGKDSTSTALTWFFWILSANPRCERRIYAEISERREAKTKTLLYEDLKEMHYLHASVSEALRLFPPVPIDSRLAVADDVLPDGTLVRAGWFADYSAYAMGRMESIWGADCHEFVPERWLENGVFVPADTFRFPVFHGGPRVCLGKEMAYVQIKSVAAAVLYWFEVKVADGGRQQPPPYTLSLTLKMKGGLPVVLKRRT